jgi:ATP-dependent Lon protease
LNIAKSDLENLIGFSPFGDNTKRINIPGLGVGMAYNSYGGSLMYIEIVKTTYYDEKVEKKTNDEVVIEDLPKGTGPGSLRITG